MLAGPESTGSMSEPSALGKALSRVLDANLRYTLLATRLATTALESAFSVTSRIGQAAAIRQAATQERVEPAEASGRPGPAAILLEGKAGSTAVGFFVVENSLPHEEHTSELQSLRHLVCRLLLEK